MTADEHAARAAELAGKANRLQRICLVDYQTGINADGHSEEPFVPAADLAMLTAITKLPRSTRPWPCAVQRPFRRRPPVPGRVSPNSDP
ncbi:MAG TPA: hypothetical protein VN408_06105 [Actinoplanes sp.]|nr:hypothetical protein [Actinoplanes sp.]